MTSKLRQERQRLHLLIAVICYQLSELPPHQPRYFIHLVVNDVVLHNSPGYGYGWVLNAFSTNRNFTDLADQLQALMPSCGVVSPENRS